MLSLVLLGLGLAFGQDNHLPGEKPVEFGEGNSKQTFGRLVQADLKELDTVVIYSKQGVVPAGSKGIVLVLGGTSGKITSEYGIQQSLAPIVNEITKRGFAAVGFQQPIYANATADEAARLPVVERYSQAERKVRWLGRSADFLLARVAKFAPQASSQVFALGRSTGAADFAEAYHQFYKGNREAAFVGAMTGMLLMGLDGHTEEEIQRWHASEVDFFLRRHPEKGDPLVIRSAPGLFRQMSWETEQARLGVAATALPKVYLAMGARDEFSPTHELEVPIRGFVASHPEGRGAIVKHDGFHDLGRAIPGVAPPMARMKVVLDDLFREPANGGFPVRFVPSETLFQAAKSANPRNSCGLEQ